MSSCLALSQDNFCYDRLAFDMSRWNNPDNYITSKEIYNQYQFKKNGQI